MMTNSLEGYSELKIQSPQATQSDSVLVFILFFFFLASSSQSVIKDLFLVN